ncbi:MAG: hypothetical protein HYY24_17845 [Verrucomicrobia bacterium]|nr:hypothetical protein [Verrucomicrobiota bacterium]
MTITDLEEAIGNDRRTRLTLVLESGEQVILDPDKYGKTKDGSRLFIPLNGSQFMIVETASVKTILK